MNNPVEPFIVRILSENGDVQGAGFMVFRRQILTCAHVVADATGTPRTEAQAPAGQIHLDFPFAHASEQRLTGRVIHWLPIRDAQTSSTSLVEDIAVIELDCEAPERRQPATLFVMEDLSGHNFSAYGFPSGHDTGHTAYGIIKDPDARGWVQIQGTSGQGYFVTRGFSGGPVWDQELNGVMGMIIGADRKAIDTRVSFMIPAKLLAEAWPELHLAPARFPIFMVDDLAEDFVRRPDNLNMAITSLTSRKQQRTMVSLHGAGGYGKTTLAKAICRDSRIREEFADGISWVDLGETPGDLTDRFQMLLHALGENHKAFSSKNLAASRLRELLADRRVLLVIDDVWDPSDLKDFVRGGPNCAYLITTRNLDALPDATSKIVVDGMKLGEAMELLGQGLKAAAIADLEPLASRLGKWPLLLKLVNRFLRYRTEDAKQPLAETLDYVNRRLASPSGVTAFDMRNARERHQAVSITLQLSLELLSAEERERYFELAIFPEDTDIPLPTLAKLWESTGGLDDFATEELCDRLYKLSLLLSLNLETMRVRLHDVLRKYLNSKLDQGQLSSIHQRLLDAHRPAAGWADLAPGDYLWDNLIAHLVAAQRGAELVETARDLSYLAATAFFRSPQSAEALLQTALDKAPDDAVLPPLKRFFIQMGHLLRRCQSREEMEALLRARLQCDGALSAKPVNWRRPSSHLAPWHTLPDQPHPSLIRTLSGHNNWIRNCALSQDGEALVSASDDCSLEVWDVKTGLPRFSLFGHTDKVFGCAINLSEKVSLIVSGSMDQTLKVWDARNGAELRTLKGHSNTVRCCAISPDGTWIVSGSLDETLKVWDARTGKLRMTLNGHEKGIWDCKISSDGLWIISASMDKTVKVWGAKSWKQQLSLEGHQDEVRCCAISSDGKWIVSGSMDGTVRVWDIRTGREHLSPLREHRDTVLGVAIGRDGKTIVSASRDKTLKVWDLGARTCLQTLTGHVDGVNACVINRDCSLIISAS